MNDTHGQAGTGWYGFDLDGTLAVYWKWEGIGHIGKPVKPMVDLIKKMHDEGKVVKVVTARVAPSNDRERAKTRYPLFAGKDVFDIPEYAARAKVAYPHGVGDNPTGFYKKEEWTAKDFVADWCMENLGFLPEIVCQKDSLMLELYDDRVKQVFTNEGILVERELVRAMRANADNHEVFLRMKEDNLNLRAKVENKMLGFWTGWFASLLISMVMAGCFAWYEQCHQTDLEKSLDNLRNAVNEVQGALRW